MILCDTGPLFALIDADQPDHKLCATTLGILSPRSLLTTWACLTEAMYLLQKYIGYPAQEELWRYFDDGQLTLHMTSPEERDRMRTLMKQYRDAPMDLADASLVAAAEVLNVSKIFTLDSHFHAYRIHDTKRFEVVP